MIRFTFSLRSLMILTLVSPVVIWLGYLWVESRQSDAIVDHAITIGCCEYILDSNEVIIHAYWDDNRVYCVDTDILDPLPDWNAMPELSSVGINHQLFTDSHLNGIQRCKRLYTVDLSDTQVTDKGMRLIRALPKCESLYLDRTNVSDAGLYYLSQCCNLKSISLKGCNITDRGLEYLTTSNTLDSLDVSGTQITDAGLSKLAKCGKLCHIYANDTCVSGSFLREWNQHSSLYHLSIVRSNMTGELLSDLVSEDVSFPATLNLTGCRLNDRSIPSLLRVLSSVKWIYLSSDYFSEEGLATLCHGQPVIQMGNRVEIPSPPPRRSTDVPQITPEPKIIFDKNFR